MHISAFALRLFTTKVLMRFALFDFLTYPIDPTSNGRREQEYPACSRSSLSCVYFSDFLALADIMLDSKLQVNSSTDIFLSCLFNITRSGLCVVSKISGGIVPPLRSRPAISERISIFSGLFSMSVVVRWLSTVLWRQVYLPWWRDIDRKFRMCSDVPLFPHSGHLETFLFPHLLRLSGVGSVFVTLFTANDNTPRGTFLMMDCHVMFSCSSIRSFATSPCIVSFCTFSFQTLRVSS